MFLAALVSEREAIARGLVESRARLICIADQERRRLEHNLHDGAQLTLTMLAVQLATGRRRAAAAPEQATGLFEDAEAQVLVAIDQLRELAHGIHPTILTDLGLSQAIRSLAAQSAIPIRVIELPPARLDRPRRTTSSPKRSRTPRSTPRPRRSRCAPRSGREYCTSRSPTTGSAAPRRGWVRASRACATASRPSEASSRSTASPAGAPGSGPRSRRLPASAVATSFTPAAVLPGAITAPMIQKMAHHANVVMG